MIIQPAPNRWSCTPAAFATATDLPVQQLIDFIGHDGSEIIYPDLPEPYCRRGFLAAEVTRVLWYYGWVAGVLEKSALHISGPEDDIRVQTLSVWAGLESIMRDQIGVFGGVSLHGSNVPHTVAWDGHDCYDPKGFIYPLSRYRVDIFYPLLHRSGT